MKVREGYIAEQVRDKSFGEILDELGARQKEVYGAFKKYGPCSTETIAIQLGKYPHTITPRVLELRELGVLIFHDYSKSSRSKKTVCRWKVKPERELTAKELQPELF